MLFSGDFALASLAHMPTEPLVPSPQACRIYRRKKTLHQQYNQVCAHTGTNPMCITNTLLQTQPNLENADNVFSSTLQPCFYCGQLWTQQELDYYEDRYPTCTECKECMRHGHLPHHCCEWRCASEAWRQRIYTNTPLFQIAHYAQLFDSYVPILGVQLNT